ncbi:hypothetical protein [Streptomyces sp. NBC_01373]|uniref:hypothetical protein n=1 Tax=Streptomyces sp. NBC_01373 TaxID=2903843 RepID=UPI002255A3E6|nr:hypothetical protein [Streptomyces sp. NBC_01373]MCX4707154.1 hypothetical protein [Streptomyces sp. NBC_01373]
MSTLVLLVILLLGLVGLILVGALAYAVHRRPALSQPLTVALTGAAVFAAVIALIVTVGGQ